MFLTIRQQLITRDENKQISAVEKIHFNLCRMKEERKEFIEDLLRFNIGHTLCNVIGTSNQRLLKLILECLPVLSTMRLFFENDLAALSLDRIMKTSFFLLQKRPEYEEILFKLLETVEKILMSAQQKHQLNLIEICDISTILNYLKDFDVLGDWGLKTRLCSTRIFRRIIHEIPIPLDDKSSEIVRRVFDDHLKCLQAIIEVRGNPNCLVSLTASKYICDINWKAVKYCSTIRDSYQSDIYGLSPPKSLHDTLILSLTSATSKSLIKSVLPHLKNVPPSSRDFHTTRDCFLNYLNLIYDLEEVSLPILDLSRTLATEGYLMFLFQEGRTQILQGQTWFPTCVNHLLSKVITNLAVEEKSLGVNLTPGDIQDFRNFILQGLLLSMESTPMINSNAFLTLVYFHHKSTKSEIEVPFEVVVKKLLETPQESLRIAEVRVLWFILAKLILREPERPRGLSEAVSKIFGAVQKLGVHRCFLDDADVLKSVLGHPLGNGIREDMLKMWIEARGEVESLWNDFTQDNLIFCLWKMIQNCSEQFIDMVQKSLEFIIFKKNLEVKIRDFFLDRIPSILESYENSKSHNFIAILGLFEGVTSDQFPWEFGVTCAPYTVRILLGEDLAPRVKYPLMRFSSRILSSAERHSDSRVARIFIEKPDVIKEICAQGFGWEREDAISAVCLRILTILLVTQKKFDIKSKEAVTVEEMEIYIPLKRSLVVSLETVRFLRALLSDTVDSPIVKLGEFSSENRRNEIVHGIYDRVIALHEMCRSDQWTHLYDCLTTILMFCERRKFRHALCLCCDSPAHFFLVFYATQNVDTSSQFFNFLSYWLNILTSLFTDGVQYALTSKEKRKRKEFAPEVPFGKTLQLLNVYINHLKDESKIDQSLFESLKTLVEKLV